jgi:threonine dehydratase
MSEDASLLRRLDDAAAIVYRALPPTPQYRWPLLCAEAGVELWLKHENHTPAGAFKVRGGVVYLQRLLHREPDVAGVVSATRGNHGQSLARAAAAHGLRCVVVVPRGNSVEKNAAMRAFGAELVEHGEDFQAAREHAQALAEREGLRMVPSFDDDLVEGVASYALELLRALPDLDRLYVPIGLGSGACGCIAARDALGLGTRIVGVTSAGARGYKLSLEAGRVVDAPVTTVLADGLAVRSPDARALALLRAGLDEVVEVDDAEVAQAMRLLFRCTHNAAEGAGAAATAAVLQQRGRLAGQKVAAVLCGGNVDSALFARVLAGGCA